jgi:hypothetical protein
MQAVKAVPLAAGLLLGSAPPLLADITRGCSAGFQILIADGSTFADLGSIEGRGSCRNKAQANECRQRARGEIDRCIAGLWRDRQKNAIAPECNSLVSGSSRSGAKLTWSGIYLIAEPNRLTARMAYAACCRMRPSAAQLQVQVVGAIEGDKSCGDLKVGQDRYRSGFSLSNYDMSCTAWREQGLCD